MKPIEEMTDKELKEAYLRQHEQVFVIDCFGVKDLQYLDLLERELDNRSIEIIETPKVRFRKGV